MGCWQIFWTFTLTLLGGQTLVRNYPMKERSDIANCHKGLYPLFTLIILALTFSGFILEIIFHDKRQKVLDNYEAFYEWQLPRVNTLCTHSTKEVNEAINTVRLNYSEKDLNLNVVDNRRNAPGFDNFVNLKYLSSHE